MIQMRLKLTLFVILSLLLAACAQEQALPTSVLEPTVEETEEAVIPQDTPTPLQRATLPPTWTPSPEPEAVQDASGGEVVQPPADPQQPVQQLSDVIAPTALEVCATFGEDRELNNRRFTPGGPVQVHWTAVQGASSYYIILVDETGDLLKEGYSIQPTFVFEPELFDADKIYGWEVYPIDPAGQQMCLSRGAELVPDTRIGS